MALPYKKLSEAEDQMRGVLEKGQYPFRVKSVIQKKTKSGAYEMLEVELGVIDNNGREITIKDWIVFMDEMAWKFRHFAATCDLMDFYEEDRLEHYHFLNKNGVVKLSIREYEKDGEVFKANAVADYIKPSRQESQAANDSAPFIDDDIPL